MEGRQAQACSERDTCVCHTGGSSQDLPAAPPRGAADVSRLTDPQRLAAVAGTGLLDTAADEVFERLAAVAARLLRMPLAFVTLVDRQRSYWTSAHGTGLAADDTIGRQNTVEESFCQYVIATDGPVVVSDAALDELTRDNPSIASMGVRAWAGYPLRSPDGHDLGSFCVVDTTPRSFTADALLLLETLADAASREVALRLALAAERERGAAHARQHDLLDANLRKLQALNAAASEMARLDSLEDVLACCTRSAVEIVGARQGVTSMTRGRDWSQVIATVQLDETYSQWQDYTTAPDGSGIYALVCETNVPMRLTQAELEAHPRWRGFGEHAAEHPPLRGWLAAPLIDRNGNNIGLVQLSDKRAPAAATPVPTDSRQHDDVDGRGARADDADFGDAEFDDADLALLVQLAGLASVALEKTETHQHDHQVAIELQRSLLPPSLPDLPGLTARARYLPGADDQTVGGDFYELLVLADGWLGAVLGDVVGHGLRSASLMGQLRTALKTVALDELRPDVVVDRLDRLLDALGGDDMATLAYAVWHPVSGELRLVLAGHPAPFVRHPGGSVRQLDAPAGLPLGAFSGGGYTASTTTLEPGSTLVLFSDGLCETRSRSIGEGLTELRQVLADAPADLDELLDTTISRMTGGRNDDDVAVLAVTTHRAGAPAARGGARASDGGAAAEHPGGHPSDPVRDAG